VLLKGTTNLALKKLAKILRAHPLVKLRIVSLLEKTHLLNFLLKVHLNTNNKNLLGKNNNDVPTYILGNKLLSKSEWYRRFEKFNSEPIPNSEKKDDFIQGIKTHSHSGAVSKPIISVLISLYQADDYLDYLLAALQKQSIAKNSEYIFILVQPSLKARKKVQSFVAHFPRSKISIFVDRIGIYEAWNTGIHLSSSDIITNWNADDTRAANSLELQVEYLNRYPDVDVVYQDVFYSFEPRLSWEAYKSIDMKSNLHSVSARYLLETGMNPPHNAPAWRKSLHAKVGMFDSELKSAGDYDFWIRVALENGIFFKVSQPHVGYYLNPKGISTIPGGPGLQETLRIRKKYLPILDEKLKSMNSKSFQALGIDLSKSADQISMQYIDAIKMRNRESIEK
jgi:glycosyltransferase involved in cell wall biosynthesis